MTKTFFDSLEFEAGETILITLNDGTELIEVLYSGTALEEFPAKKAYLPNHSGLIGQPEKILCVSSDINGIKGIPLPPVKEVRIYDNN